MFFHGEGASKIYGAMRLRPEFMDSFLQNINFGVLGLLIIVYYFIFFFFLSADYHLIVAEFSFSRSFFFFLNNCLKTETSKLKK